MRTYLLVLAIAFYGWFSGTGAAPSAQKQVGLFAGTNNALSFARVEQMLKQAGFSVRQVGLRDSWDGISLVVLVEPVIPPASHGRELTLSQKLATHYLLGGRVLVVGLRGAGEFPSGSELERWDQLVHYFWDIGLREISGALEDTDHRALFFPGAANLGNATDLQTTVERLLAAPDSLPANVPAEDFGPVPRVEIRGKSLLIDGQPVILKAAGYYDLVEQIPIREHAARLRALRAAGFNAVMPIVHYDVDDEKMRQFLDLARENGIYVQLQVQGPVDSDEPLRKEYLLKFLRFRKHPALIGWVFCDDMWEVYYPFISREVEIVARYEDRLPFTATIMNLRNPEQVPDWSKWKKLFPFALTYLYPMQKDPATLGVKGDIAGGIKDVERLAENTRRVWGDVFSEQFLQAHMQGGFAEQVGLKSWSEHLLPMAGQERLLAWRALLAGVKGLVFFYPESLEDQGMGRSRRNELSMLWHEMDLVEDTLAAGSTPVRLTTSDDSVDARRIQAGQESVVLLAKDEPYYNRYIDHAQVEGLRVNLGPVPPEVRVYQLGWPAMQGLETQANSDNVSVTLRPFALTALLLVTGNRQHADAIRSAIQRQQGEMARYAIEVLGDEYAKTDVTAHHLPADLCGTAALLESASAALERARKALASGDAAGAYQQARTGMIPLEEYRSEAIRAATADADRIGAAHSARVYLNIYFSLPLYAYATRGWPQTVPGQLRREILAVEGIPAWSFIDRAAH